MSRTYHPDSWVPVLIESEQYGKVYKVLASWYGGFARGNSWKLSSGVESIETDADGVMTMPQSSGSVYVVGQQTHISSMIGNVFESFERDAKNSEGKWSIKMITVEELLEAFKK